MNLVAAELFELVRVKRLAERLLAASVRPHRGGFLAVDQFIRIARQYIRRPSLAGMLVQIARIVSRLSRSKARIARRAAIALERLTKRAIGC
jgi:hypothetical protein